MSDDLGLLVVFDAFADEVLMLAAADLAKDEAYLVFQKAGLGFGVFFCE